MNHDADVSIVISTCKYSCAHLLCEGALRGKNGISLQVNNERAMGRLKGQIGIAIQIYAH
jgi:hypothetical protein